MAADQPDQTQIAELRDRVVELAQQRRRRGESVQFLQLITRSFVSLSLTESTAICDTLLSLATTFLEAEQGAMLLAGLEREGLAVVARHGLADDAPLVGEQAQQVWSAVLLDKTSRFVPASEVEERWPDAPEALRDGFACVSVDIQDSGVGVLLAAHKLSGASFGDVDLEFLAGAAGIAALALMYAETHATQQTLLAELEQKRAQIQTYAQREIERGAEIIQQQKSAIQALSTPILSIWDRVLALPIVGQIDTARAEQMTEALLKQIVDTGATCVIIDVTGVDVMDTATAAHFVRMIESARLLGSHCVVTGVGPEVATTSVELDLNFGNVTTLRSLREGLRHCLRHLCKANGTISARPS